MKVSELKSYVTGILASPDLIPALVEMILSNPAGSVCSPMTTGRDAAPKRPKSAIKAVGEILARAGLALRGEQRRVSQMRPVLVNTIGAKCDTSRFRVYSTVGYPTLAELLRLQKVSVQVPRRLHTSLIQLRRSLPKLQRELQQVLEQMVERDDCHREGYW